jgi:hypothetical protein
VTREDHERRYGFWRGLLDGVVARYLDCGIFERGFAHIRRGAMGIAGCCGA